jgi:membrane dipeptidase
MRYLLFLMLGLLTACASQKPTTAMSEPEDPQWQRANQLAHDYLIVDGHVDLPTRLRIINFRLEKEFLGIPIASNEGDFDYERARAGGLDAPFMSIYIPARLQETGGAKAYADSLIDMVNGIIAAHPDKFATGNSPAELERNFAAGVMSLPMGMENGAPVEDDLANVRYFYDRGVRYITLTHGKDNQICDSSYDTTGTWGGLSPFGREVVREMNRVGIMVDISHVSDNAFYQVMDMTEVPCIASHSSARKFTPGFERNMNDDMIRRLADNGGVIMINFGSSFLDGELRKRQDEQRAELRERLAAAGITDYQSAAAEPIIEAFRRENPTLYADVETVADHIDHVVSLVGVDHVGLGSDYDGVGDSLPTGLKDVSQYPNLLAVLLERGYSDADIEKICSGNLLRVWRAVEDAAQKSR